MNFDPLGFDRDLLVTIAAVLAVVCGILAAGWPYLVRDDQEERMRRVVQSSTRPRLTDPALSTEGRRRTLLRSEPSKILSAIVERFNLARKLEGGATLQLLRSAGFRGRAPVITFLAMRVLMPVIVFGVASFYIFVVIKPDLPLLAELGIAVVLSGLGYYLPTVYVKNRITKRQKSIRRSWPDALDLLLICVESGMSSEHAFRKVADEIGDQSRELAEELSLTTAELAFLSDRKTAYENLGKRTDLDGVKSVVSGLMQSEKYGTSLAHALRVLAQENRNMRMSEAEKKAAALPPKLTVPMILFFLPVLFAVVLTPAVIQIMNN
ncbi:MAG TPA: type II secretion system F family protein [Citreicella sp.]|jgi:tight adherence protein C|uniref:Tight adherence protein C n=1 Tax=Salipiger marinus TaxID=555512 RepID=A0A1G8M7P8_9RHOB|nr:type II secretion system F family protein [Salipiger marinus]SDI63952.1 tight adherence protein C [Salipiger marinus]HBM60374.1 type II secretion system F family protein [Citreicella sp.]